MAAGQIEHQCLLRVRYSETDQAGTFYNSRALEWFEVARTELLRAAGIPYAEMEQRSLRLPLVAAHIKYEGRARYDDLLSISTILTQSGKASVRFDYRVVRQHSGAPVTSGYTSHAVSDLSGKPIRPPPWLNQLFDPPTGNPT